MASPQRPEPVGPTRVYKQPKKAEAEQSAPPRQRKIPRWWWAIWIAILAAAVGWGVWGAVNNNGWWFVGNTRPGNVKGPPMSGSGVAVLQAANKQSFVGNKFEVHNVPVQKKVSSWIFWIGPKNASMLVVLQPKAAKANGTIITVHGLADVSGTVVKAPPRNSAQQLWHLSGAGAARLEREGAYIQAKQGFWVPR